MSEKNLVGKQYEKLKIPYRNRKTAKKKSIPSDPEKHKTYSKNNTRTIHTKSLKNSIPSKHTALHEIPCPNSIPKIHTQVFSIPKIPYHAMKNSKSTKIRPVQSIASFGPLGALPFFSDRQAAGPEKLLIFFRFSKHGHFSKVCTNLFFISATVPPCARGE